MRVVGGRLKGRNLASPSSRDIRPTADRLRESLFNILVHAYDDPIEDARVLDLFAGTGALGIEAVSRGAIKEGEDLDPNSPVFYQVTEDLIETRLFSLEAEARGVEPMRRIDVAHVEYEVVHRRTTRTGCSHSCLLRSARPSRAFGQFHHDRCGLPGTSTCRVGS